MKYIKTILVLLFLVIITSILLFSDNSNKINRDEINNINTETASFDKLKEVVQYKLDNTKSSVIKPLNINLVSKLKEQLQKTESNDFSKLQRISLLTPYTTDNLYHILGIPSDPKKTQVFQFENGGTGWYWSYGTFSKEYTGLNNDYNFMYYIIRLELSNPDIRKKYNLKIGETTVYLVSLGIGKNKDWYYNPLTIAQGNYVSTNSFDFTFDSTHQNGTTIHFEYSNNKFNINYSFKDSKGENCSINAIQTEISPPFLNGKNGCVPCALGLGTNYWSYTNLSTEIISITIPNSVEDFTNIKGIGWMDKQWGKGDSPNSIGSQLFLNSNGFKKIKKWGLGRYIWININLGDELQYMIYGAPSDTEKIEKNTVIKKAGYNSYSTESVLKQKTTIKILETTTVSEEMAFSDDTQMVIYPVKYQVKLDDETYIIDATDFGKCVTYDHTGNYHWAGSAKIFDISGNFIGNGFIEANEFQDFNNFINTLTEGSGLGEKDVELIEKKMTFLQSLPSIIFILIYIALYVLLFVFVIKIII